ncbi:MAG: amidohydrolase family protein [Candidatus Desulfatibia sp.]|uniref:amidohydrolase family protein n=1 Tax=Candidatus Desulfatibia sp. TaxID=3101189 RepID=UPI002F2E03D7
MIDAHVHLMTMEMLEDAIKRFEKNYPGSDKQIRKSGHKIFADKSMKYISGTSLKEKADDWLKVMDENGIEKAVFFPISQRPEQVRDFMANSPERLYGYAFINDPASHDAPDVLKSGVNEYGLCGLKLYPSIQLFHAYDKKLFALYEEAQGLGVPITFHYGITHAPMADYRYTNPLDLQLPLRLFPKLNFIIAHFGAGFFREVCLLGYHTKNLYLDTSGTNNWTEYTPENWKLKEVFKRAIEIYSPERIIFGTDTVLRPDTGYRTSIMKEQLNVVEALGISSGETDLIFGGNAKRLYFTP